MFIDPKSDYAFKRFFGTVSNKELTIGFLNSLLNKDIKDIIFHNVEMQGNNTDSRKAVFDLFCEGSDGELFIVEIQKKRQKYFSDRVLYYASFVIQMQADIESEKFRLAKEEERRRWNYHINKVYVVCFLDFRLDTRYTDKYRWDVVRMDRELKIPFSETLNEIYLELPKFNLNFEECNTFYKKFLYTSAIINTFIIALTYVIVFHLLDNWLWQLLCSIILIILLIIIMYGILGRHYQKRGKKNV